MAQAFLSRLDRSPETVRAYRTTLAGFGARAGAQAPTRAVSGLVLAYKGRAPSRWPPATLARDLAALRAFLAGWSVA